MSSLPRRTRRQPGDGRRQRRDPRAEIQSPQAQEEQTPSRLRRDPRADRGPAAPAGKNPRIDRARPLRPVEETAAPERPLPGGGRETVIIDDPAYWVLAVPDLADGRLSVHDRAVLGAARRLADAGGGAVVAIAFGTAAELGVAGADRVMQAGTGRGDDYGPEYRAAAVRAAADSLGARHVVFAESPDGGADLGRRFAAGLGELPATRIQALTPDRIFSRGDGDRVEFERPPPRVLLIAPDAVEPVTGAVHEARLLDAPAPDGMTSRITDLGELPVDPAGVPLTEAEFIVSAGNGVSDWVAFHALAAALGASEGGTRVVCDAGALTRDRQIGASGSLASARCYLALGISGAPQHLQGIADCEHVVAVNTDAGAEILKRADLGVVADVQALMPALLDLLTGGDPEDA
jgi:electron transfer flavoprotein alpha subunit